MTDSLPNGTRVRKINASAGMIPTGTTGTVKDAIHRNGKPFAYIIEWDFMPDTPAVTPVGRIERLEARPIRCPHCGVLDDNDQKHCYRCGGSLRPEGR